MLQEIINWLAMIELPVFLALFGLLIRIRRELDNDLLSFKTNYERGLATGKEALSEFKLYVARNYVSVTYLKDVETRLTDHLLRIEKKLDEVGKNR